MKKEKIRVLKMHLVLFSLMLMGATQLNAQWSTSGNSLSGGEKLGSTNNQPVDMYTNNNLVARWATGGQLLIGTTSSAGSGFMLQVNGDGYIDGNLAVTTDASVGDELDVNGTIIGHTDLYIDGSAQFNNGLAVGANGANISGNTLISGDFDVTSGGNCTIQTGLLTVGGDIDAQDDVDIAGSVGIGQFHNSTYALEINGDMNLKGNGTYNGSWTFTSDRRFKKDINSLFSVREDLLKIAPYQYYFRQNEFPEMKFDAKLHFGFIAQEIEKVYPDLVRISDKGYYSVNYTEFIPLLLQALKEENDEIIKLQNDIKTLATALEDVKANKSSTKNNEFPKSISSALYQNVPNPFSGDTKIGFNIGSKYEKAFIGIYDLNGRELKRIYVEKGSQHVILTKDVLQPGLYTYALVVDNSLIDTKKMIVE
jgi:hypothetical protein